MNDSSGKPAPDDLSVDVSAEVIQAALESVERRAGQADRSPPPEADLGEVDFGAGGAGGAAAPSLSDLQRELREVKATLELSAERGRETHDRLKETHERHLRAAADLENYKKRALREREEAERFGVQKLLKDLLPVLDNLERALAHAEPGNLLAEGVGATRRLFEDTLLRYGMKSFSAVGQPFDPTQHEAMQQVETADHPPGTVVSEMVRGYKLHERLVRPALVVVSAAPPVEATTPPPATNPPAPAESSSAPAAGPGARE